MSHWKKKEVNKNKNLFCVLILIVILFCFIASKNVRGVLPAINVSETKSTLVDETVYSTMDIVVYSLPIMPEDFSNVESLGVIRALEEFNRVEIFNNGWNKIKFNGVDGYVFSDNLIVIKPASIQKVSEQMYILNETVPVHDINAPYPEIDTLSIATKVTRIGISNEFWSMIELGENKYFVLSEHLVYERPVIFEKVDESVYINDTAKVYTSFKNGEEIGVLNWGDKVKRIAIGDNGWSKIIYNEQEAFVESSHIVKDIFPIYYEDETCKITITKEWYKKAWCYTAHLEFTDYGRFGTNCANGKYGKGTETTSHAAKRLNALFAVNGCYSAPYLGYIVVRDGTIWNGGGRSMNLPGVYSSHTGLFLNAWGDGAGGTSGIVGHNVRSLVNSGKVTDTFCFGPPSLVNGKLKGTNGGGRAQRTLIGTNGKPGDIWIVVSDGRKNDGESAGLTYYEGAAYLKSKGCTFGIHLDGGGSSTMYFNGKVLNAAEGNERAVVDFVYFK